jgi:hypothetical protein
MNVKFLGSLVEGRRIRRKESNADNLGPRFEASTFCASEPFYVRPKDVRDCSVRILTRMRTGCPRNLDVIPGRG